MGKHYPLGSKEACMVRDVDAAVARGEIRPHERDRTIELAANNWRGTTNQGNAAQSAIDAVKRGL